MENRTEKKLRVDLGPDSYEIMIGQGLLQKAGSHLDLNRKVLIVTDDGVPKEYADTVARQCREAVIETVAQGEESKSLPVFSRLEETMLKNDFTRKDCVVAVGGGVVGDLAAFAAACYMRGIDFCNVPTTVLSQVDSSIGGECAVNFAGVKNVLGAFYQPRQVVIDTDVLKTLPKRQVVNGIAEALKMAATFSEDLFEKIASVKSTEELFVLIGDAIDLKRKVVEEDEKEQGLRKVLNFGHTLGHGIEVSSDGRLLHGESIALGMLPMCDPSVAVRLLSAMKQLGFPLICNFDEKKAEEAIMHDKKGTGDGVTTVYVPKIGTYEFRERTFDELRDDLGRLQSIIG